MKGSLGAGYLRLERRNGVLKVNSVDWNLISPEKFEQLCALLLECNDFTNIQWFGKHGMDKGRDLVAENIVNPLPHITEVNKWLTLNLIEDKIIFYHQI